MKLTIPLLLILIFLCCSCGVRNARTLAQHDSFGESVRTESPYYLVITDRDTQTEEVWYVQERRARKSNQEERQANKQRGIQDGFGKDQDKTPTNDRDLGSGGDKKPIQDRDLGTGADNEPTGDRDLGKGSDKEPMPSD